MDSPWKSVDIMDASGSIVDGQNRKLGKGENAENGEDRITDLSEALVSHILSLLPTKDAVRTSVLSTRWKYMWTSVTSLHFDDRLRYSRKGRTKKVNFMNFVDRVLVHCGNSTIQNFHLRCGTGYDASRVNSWISAVIRREVKRLHIVCHEKDVVFPRCLFSCNSLTELNISMFCTLKVPTLICFPSVKILKLNGVTFSNEHFSKSRHLHFSFPVLEVFYITSCKWLNVKIVNIDAPVLNSLIMGYCYYEWKLDGSRDFAIKIRVPSLEKFTWQGYGSENIILLGPSSICDAAVKLSSGYCGYGERNHMHESEIGLRACMLLKQISNVKHLTLSDFIIEVLAHVENLQAILPSFDKLIHLRVGGYSGKLVVSRVFMDLLRSLPVLETLIFTQGISHWAEDEFVQEMLPQCFQSSLKVVEFQKFYGKEHEYDLLKFLLENAMVLEEMVVVASKWGWDPKIDMEQVKKQLLTFPKGSNCATIVHHKLFLS